MFFATAALIIVAIILDVRKSYQKAVLYLLPLGPLISIQLSLLFLDASTGMFSQKHNIETFKPDRPAEGFLLVTCTYVKLNFVSAEI